MIEVEIRETVKVEPQALQRARVRSGLSGRAIARELGLKDHNLISKLESGKRTRLDFDRLRSIAAVMSGNGDYEDVESADVLDEILGLAVIEKKSVVRRLDEAPPSTPSELTAPDLRALHLKRLDKEEAPTEAGASKGSSGTTFGPLRGPKPQMS